jgi:hypothetical protein
MRHSNLADPARIDWQNTCLTTIGACPQIALQ